MKSSIATLLAAAAFVSANPNPAGLPPGNVKINCAKPNANYCMSGDIILRCDASALGTRSLCSDDMPNGSCKQSSLEAGDAVCVNENGRGGGSNDAAVTGTMSVAPPPGSSAMASVTGVVSIPEGTSLGTAVMSTQSHAAGSSSSAGEHQSTDDCPAPTSTGSNNGGGGGNNGGNTTATGGGSGTTPSASGSAVPSAAANANQVAGGVFAAAGLVAALML